MIELLLITPFFLTPVMATFFLGQFNAGVVIALSCIVFAVFWVAAAHVGRSGQFAGSEKMLLVVGPLALAFLVVLSGGTASPALLLCLIFPIEAWWVLRSRKAARWGLAASLLSVLLVPIIPQILPASLHPEPATGWTWLIPVLYGLTVAVRVRLGDSEKISSPDPTATLPLLNLMQCVTCRVNGDGSITGISGPVRDLFAAEPQHLCDKGLFNRLHVADRVDYLSALSQIRQGASHRSIRMRVRLPSERQGQDDYHAFRGDLVAVPATDKPCYLVLRSDAEFAHMKRDLEQASDRAEQNEISRNRFLGTVSHELRTPLNSIIGFSEMLLHNMCGEISDPRQREYLELIEQSGSHLLSVVNAILDITKIESGAYPIVTEPFDFKRLIDVCCRMLQPQVMNKKLVLDDRVSSQIGEFQADRRAVQQILINLVSNAIKFTPENGVITIDAARDGQWLNFSVSDTGIGIDSSDLNKLGQPFTQVHNEYSRRFEGAGLGLSLVKGLVALHHGKMQIESAKNLGTTVTISLPGNASESHIQSIDVPYRKMERRGNEALLKIA